VLGVRPDDKRVGNTTEEIRILISYYQVMTSATLLCSIDPEFGSYVLTLVSGVPTEISSYQWKV
jgi:hypothetical protein